MTAVADDIAAANAEFYAAIEAGDVRRLDAVWDDTDDVVCIHLGWPAVQGRARVSRSWAVILANTSYLQFFPTAVDVAVSGDVAVVTCEHGLLARITDNDRGLGETARVVATNVYRRRGDRWRLWAHHASSVPAAAAEPADD